MGVDRVLHSQGMQAVRLGNVCEVLCAGLVQTEPDEAVDVRRQFIGGAGIDCFAAPSTVDVDRTVHDRRVPGGLGKAHRFRPPLWVLSC